jgi:hypothetical protein
MEQINNDLTIKECSKVLGHEVETIPLLETSKIILTSEINPSLLKSPDQFSNTSGSSIKTTTGTLTGITLSTNKDFYLVSISGGYSKDNLCDSASGTYAISGFSNGLPIYLIQLPILTLTAQNEYTNIVFNRPIKIDRGTSITMNGTFAAGACVRSMVYMGYYL